MISTPESCLYDTATIRYTAYGVVKLLVEVFTRPEHQVFGAVAGEYRRLFIVMVLIDSYLGGAFLDCVCSHGGLCYYSCFGRASLECVCSHAILAMHHLIVFATMPGSFVGDDGFSAFANIRMSEPNCFCMGRYSYIMVVEIDPCLGEASLDYVCSHARGRYLVMHHAMLKSPPSSSLSPDPIIISSDLSVAARHRACSHAMLCEVDKVGKHVGSEVEKRYVPSSSLSLDPIINSSDLGVAARHSACSHAVLCEMKSEGDIASEMERSFA
nr:hypothetical protein [Tanacetum cinerariifolium]